MRKQTPKIVATSEVERGATVIITHRVLDGHQADYEDWLNEIVPLCKSQPGHMDTQIIRPIAGVTSTYTVIIRFDTSEHAKLWMGSRDRKQLIDKVQHLLASEDKYLMRSGLEFLFGLEESKSKVPKRWKQFLVTWSAIYPLVLGVTLVIEPIMRQLGLFQNRYLTTLLLTCTVVLLMVYLVMPRYTKLLHKWLVR